jgi:flagellar protein FliL
MDRSGLPTVRCSNCFNHLAMTEAAEKTRTTIRTAAAPRPTVVVREKSSAGLIAGILLLAVVGGGGSAWFVLEREATAEASKQVGANGAPKYLVHLEGFTVNLADPEETHFLRVTMDLGIDRLPEGVEKEKVAASLPVARIRDAILSVLTLCKADALLTPAGKADLKKSLVESLNNKVPELGVKDVYFTEFLVQR